MKNWSFEDRDMEIPGDGVYGCPPWESNNGGWRELRGDADEDGKCDYHDQYLLSAAYGSQKGDSNYDWRVDFNGDGKVNYMDLGTLALDFGKAANRIDGSYSWYTSGGGDYQMYQGLDSDVVKALAGEKVEFSFWFYPESVAGDGSQNNARAEIYYEYFYGVENDTVYGVWVAPTELKWWNAHVTANLPSTVIAVHVIIHGQPDFKAWVDVAQLTTPDYNNLYCTYPPYDNLDTYPENGHCITWYKYPEFAIARVCVYADHLTGLALAYSWDASGIGSSRVAYAKFNMNPVPGNSPQVYEEDNFRIGAYWIVYGYLGSSGPAVSRVSILLDVYYLEIGVGWQHVNTYEWFYSSLDYPDQEIFYRGSVSRWISPQSGSGFYTVVARVLTSAANVESGSAVADFCYELYYTLVGYIKMSD